jgi:hypothetical protein
MYCFTPRLMFSSRSSAPDRTYIEDPPVFFYPSVLPCASSSVVST